MERRGFAAVMALLALTPAVSACGSSSDKDKITSVITITAENPKDFCNAKYVTSKFIASAGGEQKCLSETAAPSKNLQIHSVTISGDTAVAKVSDSTGPGTAMLVKQSGTWKIDSAKSD